MSRPLEKTGCSMKSAILGPPCLPTLDWSSSAPAVGSTCSGAVADTPASRSVSCNVRTSSLGLDPTRPDEMSSMMPSNDLNPEPSRAFFIADIKRVDRRSRLAGLPDTKLGLAR